jgi:hypothetical protein
MTTSIFSNVELPSVFAIINDESKWYYGACDGNGKPLWVEDVFYAKKYSDGLPLHIDLRALRDMGYQVHSTDEQIRWR